MVVTVLIICGDSVAAGEEAEARGRAQDSSRDHYSCSQAQHSPRQSQLQQAGQRNAFQGAPATLSLSLGSWAGGRCWQLPWEGVKNSDSRLQTLLETTEP